MTTWHQCQYQKIRRMYYSQHLVDELTVLSQHTGHNAGVIHYMPGRPHSYQINDVTQIRVFSENNPPFLAHFDNAYRCQP